MEDKKHIDGREFVSLLTANQNRVYAYIFTLVPNASNADDIMQETTSFMWERKEDFEPGTDFLAWGIRIAYFKVLDYRKKVRKQRRMIFADEQLREVADNALVRSEKQEYLAGRMKDCIKKLSDSDKHLIHLRYSVPLTVKEIAARFNKSIRIIYYNLSRVQGTLLECIERGL